MVGFVIHNLGANDYVGLMTASRNADENDKYGIQEEITHEPKQDFKFIRFFINGVDYLNKVVTGVPNVKRDHNEPKDDNAESRYRPQKKL